MGQCASNPNQSNNRNTNKSKIKRHHSAEDLITGTSITEIISNTTTSFERNSSSASPSGATGPDAEEALEVTDYSSDFETDDEHVEHVSEGEDLSDGEGPERGVDGNRTTMVAQSRRSSFKALKAKRKPSITFDEDSALYVHGVVKKTGCETFVINFDGEVDANQCNYVNTSNSAPPKRLRPLKKTPHRLKVRPRDQDQIQQRPFTANSNLGQVNKVQKQQNSSSQSQQQPSQKQNRRGLRSAFANRASTAKNSKGNFSTKHETCRIVWKMQDFSVTQILREIKAGFFCYPDFT